MSIDKDTVSKVAKLARIALTEEETNHFAGELSGILDWIEQLSEVDTTDVPPMAGVGHYTMRLREDKVTEQGRSKDVLANAPKSDYGCFMVPKVIE